MSKLSKAERKAKKHNGHNPSPSQLLGNEAEDELLEPEAKEDEKVEATAEAKAEAGKTTDELLETPTTDDKAAEVPAKGEEPAEAPAEQSAKEATVLEEIVAKLPPELREKALAELGKLQKQAERNEAAKMFAAFDKAMQEKLPAFIEALAEEHKASLKGRVIRIEFPEDGSVSYTNAPKGKRGKASGKGFPGKWGAAESRDKSGKVLEKADSPSKLAESMGLQVEGKRNMLDVFENPSERGTKAELPKIYSVEAIKGEFFRVTINS